MQMMKQAAAEFLAGKRVAVTGVSRHPKDHGSNVVYQRLRQRGYAVSAVNPNADQVDGDTCYYDLKSIPGGVDWVVIGTKPETAAATMQECAERGQQEDHEQVETGERLGTQQLLEERQVQPGELQRQGGGDRGGQF